MIPKNHARGRVLIIGHCGCPTRSASLGAGLCPLPLRTGLHFYSCFSPTKGQSRRSKQPNNRLRRQSGSATRPRRSCDKLRLDLRRRRNNSGRARSNWKGRSVAARSNDRLKAAARRPSLSFSRIGRQFIWCSLFLGMPPRLRSGQALVRRAWRQVGHPHRRSLYADSS